MPVARFQLPDGRIARFEVPEGTSPEQMQSAMAAHFAARFEKPDQAARPIKIGKDALPVAFREVLGNADWATRNIAGAGTALSNLWHGAKQLVGAATDRQAIDNNKIIAEEAPAGSLAGTLATTALPFGLAGNSLRAAGAVGAGLGAMQPIAGEQTLSNIAQGKAKEIALGGVLGAGGQFAANKIRAALAGKASDLLAQQSKNAVKDATLAEARAAGYVVPPSMASEPNLGLRILEGVSGKYKTNQLAGVKNQEATNVLARRALGLTDDAPLSADTISRVREAAYAPYREIANLPASQAVKADPLRAIQGKHGFDPKQTLEDLKSARADTTAWFNAYNRSAHPEDLAKAKSFQSRADALEGSLERYAASVGRDDLVPALREARQMIAKTYTVERALEKGSGNIDAKVLGRMYEKGKPLSGGLDTAGKFASAFGDVAGLPKSGHANPFTILDAGYATGLATVHPAAATLPLSRVGARYGLLSGPVQNALAHPSYTVSPAIRMAGGLLDYTPVGATAFGLNALNQ